MKPVIKNVTLSNENTSQASPMRMEVKQIICQLKPHRISPNEVLNLTIKLISVRCCTAVILLVDYLYLS